MGAIFENLNIYIVPLSFGRKRCELLEKNVRLYSGTLAEKVDSTSRPTHIIFHEDFHDKKLDVEAVLKKIHITSQEVGVPCTKVVSAAWLCQCVKAKKRLCTEAFEFRPKVLELIEADPDAAGEKTCDQRKRKSEDPRGDADVAGKKTKTKRSTR